MRRNPTVLLVLLAGLCASLPGRDARAQGVVLPLPAPDAAVLAKKLGAGVVGAALPSTPLDDPSVYFPLAATGRPYYVTNGDKAGQTVKLTVTRAVRPNGTSAWRFELSPTVAAFLRATPGGDLLTTAIVDAGAGLVVVTTPANPFLLKGMQPGESRDLAQTVSVKYLDDPSDQKYAGSLTGTCTYLGTYQVTVPGGTFPAVLIRHHYTGTIGPADTQDTAYYLLAAGVGVVAMISQEDIEAFWIVHIDTSTGKVLAAAPAAAAD